MQYQFCNSFAYPRDNTFGKLLNFTLNNKLFTKSKRVLFYPFTKARLKSNISNVVYLNWLVPIEKVMHLIPDHIKVKSYNGKALLTVLTYNHGHFRPATLDRFKICFGSPLQSNWRLYIEQDNIFETKEPTVFFIKNIISSFTYAVGSRLFSNILHTHLPVSFIHECNDSGIITQISPGTSNSPDLEVCANLSSAWNIPEEFKSAFKDTDHLLKEICEQDFAISDQHDSGQYCLAQIRLLFNYSAIRPLEVTKFKSNWLGDILAECNCLAFVIPEVTFLTLKEELVSI